MISELFTAVSSSFVFVFACETNGTAFKAFKGSNQPLEKTMFNKENPM